MPSKAASHGAPARRYLNEKVTGVLLEGMKRLAADQYVYQRRGLEGLIDWKRRGADIIVCTDLKILYKFLGSFCCRGVRIWKGSSRRVLIEFERMI